MSNLIINPYAFATAGAGPGGTVSFIASASVTYGTSSGSVITVPMPSGVAEDDIVIFSIAYNDAGAVITPPAGATLTQGPTSVPASTGRLLSYWYKVPASPPASLSFSMSASANRRRGISVAFRGANTTTPIDTSDASAESTTVMHTAPAITTSVANAYVLTMWYAFAGLWDTPYPDTTLNGDIASPSGLSGMLATGAVRAAAGPGTPPSALTTNARAGATHAIALTPA